MRGFCAYLIILTLFVSKKGAAVIEMDDIRAVSPFKFEWLESLSELIQYIHIQ